MPLLAELFPAPNPWFNRLVTAKNFEGPQAGRVAAFDAKLVEDVAQVFLDGKLGRPQNLSHFAIGLALSDPEQHFGFARGKAVGFERRRRTEIGTEVPLVELLLQALILEAAALEPGMNGAEQIVLDDGFGQVIVRAKTHARAQVRAWRLPVSAPTSARCFSRPGAPSQRPPGRRWCAPGPSLRSLWARPPQLEPRFSLR